MYFADSGCCPRSIGNVKDAFCKVRGSNWIEPSVGVEHGVRADANHSQQLRLK